MWLKAASARYNRSCNMKCRFDKVVVRVVASLWSDAQHTDDAQLVFKFLPRGQRPSSGQLGMASWRRGFREQCSSITDADDISSLVDGKGMICDYWTRSLCCARNKKVICIQIPYAGSRFDFWPDGNCLRHKCRACSLKHVHASDREDEIVAFGRSPLASW
jgi:hypothetical protein